MKNEKCDTTKIHSFLQTYIPEITFRTEIWSEASFIIPSKYLHIFPEMLSNLEKSMEELDIMGYGLSISPLNEVYKKVCADNSKEGIDFNIELINCNRFKLYTGMKLYLAQWIAMLYKRFLVSVKSPKVLIFQTVIIAVIAMISCISQREQLWPDSPAFNISLSSYKNAKVLFHMSNDSDVKLRMLPLASYLRDYFKNFHEESILITKANFTAILADPTEKFIETLDSEHIGGIEFADTENVSIHFNNFPLHSMPIMVLLWINAITKFELGEEYNVEVVNRPLSFETDLVSYMELLSEMYAEFTVLGLGFGLAFVGYHLTRARAGKKVLLQLLGGLRKSTLLLSNLLWNWLLVLFFVTIILVISFVFGTSLADPRYFLILMNAGLGIILLAYVTSYCFNDPYVCVAFIALKDLILTVIIFPYIKSILKAKKDSQYLYMWWLAAKIIDYIFNLDPSYGGMSAFQKVNKMYMIHKSCETACILLQDRHPERYENCSAEAMCNYPEPMRREMCCGEFYFLMLYTFCPCFFGTLNRKKKLNFSQSFTKHLNHLTKK